MDHFKISFTFNAIHFPYKIAEGSGENNYVESYKPWLIDH